jgi:hypothetical protein
MKSWSRDTKWRQGCMILAENCKLFSDSVDGTIGMATSHDCDIAHDNIKVEPYVEFILGKIIDQSNHTYESAKNPRLLHIEIIQENNTVVMEIIAHKKYLIEKNELVHYEPDERFKLKDIHTLQSWLAARYRRQTLPNSLVSRLEPVFKFIEEKAKKYPSGVITFFIGYEPKSLELSKDELYEFSLYIIYPVGNKKAAEDAHDIAEALNANFDKLISKTNALGQVQLDESLAYSEAEFTLHDLRRHIEYKLEYLSNRMPIPGPIVV